MISSELSLSRVNIKAFYVACLMSIPGVFMLKPSFVLGIWCGFLISILNIALLTKDIAFIVKKRKNSLKRSIFINQLSRSAIISILFVFVILSSVYISLPFVFFGLLCGPMGLLIENMLLLRRK